MPAGMSGVWALGMAEWPPVQIFPLEPDVAVATYRPAPPLSGENWVVTVPDIRDPLCSAPPAIRRTSRRNPPTDNRAYADGTVSCAAGLIANNRRPSMTTGTPRTTQKATVKPTSRSLDHHSHHPTGRASKSAVVSRPQ